MLNLRPYHVKPMVSRGPNLGWTKKAPPPKLHKTWNVVGRPPPLHLMGPFLVTEVMTSNRSMRGKCLIAPLWDRGMDGWWLMVIQFLVKWIYWGEPASQFDFFFWSGFKRWFLFPFNNWKLWKIMAFWVALFRDFCWAWRLVVSGRPQAVDYIAFFFPQAWKRGTR